MKPRDTTPTAPIRNALPLPPPPSPPWFVQPRTRRLVLVIMFLFGVAAGLVLAHVLVKLSRIC